MKYENILFLFLILHVYITPTNSMFLNHYNNIKLDIKFELLHIDNNNLIEVN